MSNYRLQLNLPQIRALYAHLGDQRVIDMNDALIDTYIDLRNIMKEVKLEEIKDEQDT